MSHTPEEAAQAERLVRDLCDQFEKEPELVQYLWETIPVTLQEVVDKLERSLEKQVKRYFIWSHEHSAWWRAESNGYTKDFSEAGIYTEDEAFDICQKANQYLPALARPNEVCIPFEAVHGS